jgi:hypothetical protein
MTEHHKRFQRHNSATLLPADKSGFVPHHIRHGLFENSIDCFTSVSKPEGAA